MAIATPLEELRAAHKLLAEYQYALRPVERGYANRTLLVDLSKNEISEKPVTQEMKDIFTGGRGFCLWLLWKAVQGGTTWDAPENELVIAGGPIGGITSYPGSGKSTVVTISPLTGSVVDSNVGGHFGPYLKFSGFDAMEIRGKAEQEVIVVIDGDTGSVRIEEAPLESINTHLVAEELTALYGGDERGRRAVSVVSAGQAADHVHYASLNVSWFDPRRGAVRYKQAGRGGTGRVFRDKKLKAIVVRKSGVRSESNNPADLTLIRKAGKRINQEIADLDDAQNQMRKRGTPYLVDIMDHFDLLPVMNFRFGSHPDVAKIGTEVWKSSFRQGLPDGCWLGCTMSCSHAIEHFHLKSGPYAGQAVMVEGPEYETVGALGSNIGVFDPEAIAELNFYADTYGVDTISLGDSIAFVMECYEARIITKEDTGGLELNWGNAESAFFLLHQMARGEGFGAIVGRGVRFMKTYFAKHFGGDAGFLHDIAMENKGMEFSEYVTKESLAQQGGYCLTNKGAQHDEAWLIFMDQINNQIPTFEDKAEALHYFPMWRTWFSLHGLCKLPWNDILPESNAQTDEPAKVPEHVENYTWLYEGVTGTPVTADDLIAQSERVYNFQRVFNLKMGFGTREHDYPPYRAMGPVTVEEYESRAERYDKQLAEEGLDPSMMSSVQKVARMRALREERYDKLVAAVYARRGWDENGIPTLETLKKMRIDFPDVVEVAEKHRL
jgi:aldehyde:ferredoxin oxidoreductase